MVRAYLFPAYSCSNGHDRVEWGPTGGHNGQDRLCWYCRQPIETKKPPYSPAQ